MLRSERLLADCERPLEERPRGGEIALGLKQAGEVVETCGGFGMLRSRSRTKAACSSTTWSARFST